MVAQLSGNNDSQFTFIPKLQNINESNIKALQNYADEIYKQKIIRGENDIEDLKIKINRN
jgi:hypothetical protein